MGVIDVLEVVHVADEEAEGLSAFYLRDAVCQCFREAAAIGKVGQWISPLLLRGRCYRIIGVLMMIPVFSAIIP